MLRRENTHSLHWADKTLSMLRATQLEACEKELAGLSQLSLFDSSATDLDAEVFFDQSYYAQEEHTPVLHSLESLRALVLENFPAEMALLSEDEHELLVKLCLSKGRLPLQDPEDSAPAASLIRRLWCGLDRSGEEMILLLPDTLWLSAMLLLSGEAHHAVRDLVDEVNITIEDSLYLLGAAPINAPIRHLESLLKDTFLGSNPEIASRMVSRLIHSAYEYVITPDGQTLLIHPGFAEPDRLLFGGFQPIGLFGMDEEALSAALQSMDEIEDPLYLRMEGLLHGAIRPELTLEGAVQDLILLAKQDVSLWDMQDVLSSLLIQQPTPEMLRALRDVHDLVPRWLSLTSSRVQ